jgi:hypothetical protein
MSKKRTIHGIDPTAPGGIEALLAHHRLTFGDATMSVAPGEPAPAEPAPAPVPSAPATPPAAAKPWGDDSQFDPDKAWTLIENLRAELKTKAAPPVPAPAPLAAPVAPAPAEPAPAVPDPETEALRTENRNLRIDSAIIASPEGNPLILAVLKGEGKLTDLDPKSSTFQADLDKLVSDAVKTHPQLKTVQAAGASGANFPGGSGESAKKPTTLAGAVANHYRT